MKRPLQIVAGGCMVMAVLLTAFSFANLKHGWVTWSRIDSKTTDSSSSLATKGSSPLGRGILASGGSPALGMVREVSDSLPTGFGLKCNHAAACAALKGKLPDDWAVDVKVEEWSPPTCRTPWFNSIDGSIRATLSVSAVGDGLWHNYKLKLNLGVEGRALGLFRCAEFPDLASKFVEKIRQQTNEALVHREPSHGDRVVDIAYWCCVGRVWPCAYRAGIHLASLEV